MSPAVTGSDTLTHAIARATVKMPCSVKGADAEDHAGPDPLRAMRLATNSPTEAGERAEKHGLGLDSGDGRAIQRGLRMPLNCSL